MTRPDGAPARSMEAGVRLLAMISVVAGMATAVSACGSGSDDTLLAKKIWVVGVRPDLPGLGMRRPDGTFEGCL